ncbi:MAG: hypothetical protein EG828_05660 [Deltaproteobacteria bacterium]|nr:hypothetical protein [Deltaproteobacteria bacterium]
MNFWFNKYFAILVLLLLVTIPADAASETVAISSSATSGQKTAAPFSFDAVWFYRDGTRVIPEIGKRWLTVVFDLSKNSDVTDFESNNDSFIQEKAKAILVSNDRLIEYIHDPNLAEDACFFRMRDGLTLEDIGQLISQVSQDEAVKYVHPTVILNNKTFAFFNEFQLEWKTGTGQAQREALLSAAHATLGDKENHYVVDVTALAFFTSLNLLAEDVKVLRATPYLVEVKPSISATLSLFMRGGNIGDSIPFTLTIAFSDRVSIDPSSLATLNLRPENIQKELFDCTFDPYDYTKAVTKSPIVISGRLKFYAPGEFTIPAVAISYTCPSCPDSSVRSIETAPVQYKVSSIIPTAEAEKWLIVPTDPVSPDFRLAALNQQSRRFFWLAISCFAGLIPLIVWLFLLRRKVTAERDRLKEQKKDQLLARQLRTLLQATPPAPHWSYVAEVGTLLREYLVVLCEIDVKYQGGSGKQFMETISAHLPGECVSSLGNIFAAIDTSVSLESEHCQDIDQLQREILEVVDSTAHNNAAHG